MEYSDRAIDSVLFGVGRIVTRDDAWAAYAVVAEPSSDLFDDAEKVASMGAVAPAGRSPAAELDALAPDEEGMARGRTSGCSR